MIFAGIGILLLVGFIPDLSGSAVMTMGFVGC
jgi:hypothetical protein